MRKRKKTYNSKTDKAGEKAFYLGAQKAIRLFLSILCTLDIIASDMKKEIFLGLWP